MLSIEKNKNAVSPVIAVILMVAITVVLAGIVYYWVSQLSSTSDDRLSYVGYGKSSTDQYWEITIEKVSGSSIILEDIHFLIRDLNGIVKYKKTIADSNPKPFISELSKIYPIAANASGVVSTQTSLPVTADDDPINYLGAIYVIIDHNRDGVLNTADTIRIYSDIDGDGTQDIVVGEYFKIVNLAGNHEYLKCHL